MKTVTVVLNGFKRQNTLAEQVESLKNQTYPIAKIFYFNFKSADPQFIPDYELLDREGVEYAETSHHYGVWGRFTFALNANTDFVCIMDDDIVPGKKYIENCVSSYEKQPGIYGTMGSLFEQKNGVLHKVHNYGWKDINNDKAIQVNYLFQTWFMPRKALNSFWSEMVPDDMTHNRRIGEDMTVSLMAQKKLGLKSYVVPHPANDKCLWGNTTGDKYGVDEFAVHVNPDLQKAMEKYFYFVVDSGLETPGFSFKKPNFIVNILKAAAEFFRQQSGTR